jgi:hypothetical protein
MRLPGWLWLLVSAEDESVLELLAERKEESGGCRREFPVTFKWVQAEVR